MLAVRGAVSFPPSRQWRRYLRGAVFMNCGFGEAMYFARAVVNSLPGHFVVQSPGLVKSYSKFQMSCEEETIASKAVMSVGGATLSRLSK